MNNSHRNMPIDFGELHGAILRQIANSKKLTLIDKRAFQILVSIAFTRADSNKTFAQGIDVSQWNSIMENSETALQFKENAAAHFVENLCTKKFGFGYKYQILSLMQKLALIAIVDFGVWKVINSKRKSGSILLGIAEFFFSKKRFREVFEPIVADMRDEEAQALSEGRHWKAKWVRWHGRYCFLKAMGFGSMVWFAAFILGKLLKIN